MNWKTTFLAVILAGAAGAWFFKGDTWGPEIGIKPAHPEPPKTAATGVLDGLTPSAITRVEITAPAGDALVIERDKPGAEWKMPGNWPPRTGETTELVDLLGHLRTRFHAIPIGEGADLGQYGLAADQKPIAVKVAANGQSHTLTFGQPKVSGDETSFTRPAFVRVDSASEVLKLGPEVMPVIRRPAEAYRRRQLFPDAERVKIAAMAPPLGGPASDAPIPVTLPGDETESITITLPPVQFFGFDLSAIRPSFTLARSGKLPEPGVTSKGGEPAIPPDRLADVWRLTAPVASNAEPTRLRPVLAAVADLWVNRFVAPNDAGFALDSRFALAQLMPIAFEPPIAAVVRAYPEVAYLDPIKSKFSLEERTGLAHPDRSVTVKRKGAEPVTIEFGGVAKVTFRDESISVPVGSPGSPPRNITQKIATEQRFARVSGNPQLFAVSGDKFADLFASAESLTDPRVARFETNEIESLTLQLASGQSVALTRKKGDPDAKTDEAKSDRWFLDAKPNPVLADTGRVNELLVHLSGLRTDRADRRQYPPAPPSSRMTIAVVVREQRPKGEPEAAARRYELVLGQPDLVERVLPVWVAGQQRISLIDDHIGTDSETWLASLAFPETLSAWLERPAITYRDRKLFDVPSNSLESLTAVTSDGGGFTLSKANGTFKLTAPIATEADATAASALAGNLSNLRVADYLTDAPTETELAGFGLDKPKIMATMAFGEGKKHTLEIGIARPGKPEVYARLDRGAVFTLPTATSEQLTTGAIGLLPLRIWNIPQEKVSTLEVTRFGDASKEGFALTKEGGNWKLSGPFTAVGSVVNAKQMIAAFTNLNAVKYQAISSANAAEFGFDKPLLAVKVTFSEKKPTGEEIAETKTITVGALAPDGVNRFARLDAPNAPVFLVPATFIAAAQIAPLDLLDRTLLTFDPATLTGLTRRIGKDDLEIAPAAAIGWDVVKPAKYKADQPFVEELADALGRLRADRVVVYGKTDEVFKKYGLESPAAIITVTVGDKAEQKTLRIGDPTDLVRLDGDRYAAVESANPEAVVGVLPAALMKKLLAAPVAFRDRTLAKFVDADKAVLERGDRKITFAKVGVTWKVTEPLAAAAESAELEAFVADLGKLRADTWVGEKAKDLKAFGLDKSEAKWTLSEGDKTVLVLLVGKKATDGRVHVATDKGELIGLLDPTQSARILAEYRQRRPWDVDAAQIESVEIAKGDTKFTLFKSGPSWLDTAKPTDIIDARVVNELLGTLGGLKVERYAADKDADPKLFGFEKPEAIFTLSGGGMKWILELGGPVGGTDGKQRYARVVDKGHTEVFVLSATDTARLTRDRSQYLEKK